MNLFEIPLTDLTPEHLNALVDNTVSETSTLEFKRETYGGSDEDKRELLKDVSALANTHGGLLFIGIGEEKGCADSIFPFKGDVDAEIQRLHSISASSIEPTITDIDMRSISVKDGSVIVIKVPKSWSAPHRMNFRGRVIRFYKRNSAGVYEPDVTELKKMFNASIERETQFKELRQRHINCVKREETPVVMPISTDESGFMLLQLIPLQALEGIETIDLGSDHLKDYLWPIGATSGYDRRYNIDGLATFDAMFHSYTQLYRNGIIEAAICSIANLSNGDNP